MRNILSSDLSSILFERLCGSFKVPTCERFVYDCKYLGILIKYFTPVHLRKYEHLVMIRDIEKFIEWYDSEKEELVLSLLDRTCDDVINYVLSHIDVKSSVVLDRVIVDAVTFGRIELVYKLYNNGVRLTGRDPLIYIHNEQAVRTFQSTGKQEEFKVFLSRKGKDANYIKDDFDTGFKVLSRFIRWVNY